jgi:hypothetical protein
VYAYVFLMMLGVCIVACTCWGVWQIANYVDAFKDGTAFRRIFLGHVLILHMWLVLSVLQELREANEALRRQLDEKDARITALEDAAEEAAAAAAQTAEQQRQDWELEREQHRQQLQAQQEQVGGWAAAGAGWCQVPDAMHVDLMPAAALPLLAQHSGILRDPAAALLQGLPATCA